MTEQEFNLLSSVAAACKANPAFMLDVVSAANRGQLDRLDELNRMNADLETLAVLAMAKRTKNLDGAILKKLERINGHSYVRWDDEIATLKSKVRHD